MSHSMFWRHVWHRKLAGPVPQWRLDVREVRPRPPLPAHRRQPHVVLAPLVVAARAARNRCEHRSRWTVVVSHGRRHRHRYHPFTSGIDAAFAVRLREATARPGAVAGTVNRLGGKAYGDAVTPVCW